MLKEYNVYLRALEKKDIFILHKLCNDEKVKVYNTIPNDIQSSSKRLRKALGIINEKNTLVGFITYKESNDYKGIYSIGITIGSMYWGKKYGQNSMKMLLKYLFKELNAIRVELEVIRYNLRAINCYKKCGFVEEEIKRSKVYINGEYIDTMIMRISKKELVNI
jgi:RimJ/RimL family protein N-acetyltransferase